MKQTEPRNISMMMDLYEMTMANGYFKDKGANDPVTFDVFYRKIRTERVMLFLQVWNRYLIIWKICILIKKIFNTCIL